MNTPHEHAGTNGTTHTLTADDQPDGFTDAVIAWLHIHNPLGAGWSIEPRTIRVVGDADHTCIHYDRVRAGHHRSGRRKHIQVLVDDPARFAQAVALVTTSA